MGVVRVWPLWRATSYQGGDSWELEQGGDIEKWVWLRCGLMGVRDTEVGVARVWPWELEQGGDLV